MRGAGAEISHLIIPSRVESPAVWWYGVAGRNDYRLKVLAGVSI